MKCQLCGKELEVIREGNKVIVTCYTVHEVKSQEEAFAEMEEEFGDLPY